MRTILKIELTDRLIASDIAKRVFTLELPLTLNSELTTEKYTLSVGLVSGDIQQATLEVLRAIGSV